MCICCRAVPGVSGITVSSGTQSVTFSKYETTRRGQNKVIPAARHRIIHAVSRRKQDSNVPFSSGFCAEEENLRTGSPVAPVTGRTRYKPGGAVSRHQASRRQTQTCLPGWSVRRAPCRIAARLIGRDHPAIQTLRLVPDRARLRGRVIGRDQRRHDIDEHAKRRENDQPDDNQLRGRMPVELRIHRRGFQALELRLQKILFHRSRCPCGVSLRPSIRAALSPSANTSVTRAPAGSFFARVTGSPAASLTST